MKPGIYRWTAKRFRNALDSGFFGERKVELLGGIPFVMAENPLHILCCYRVFSLLSTLAARPRWVVNKDHRLALGQWLPLPDAVVLGGPDTIYGSGLARPDDVALVVEVSESTYRKDSGPKLRRYASFGIPIYWIIDLHRRLVEVRSQPYGKGKKAGYARCETYLENDHVPVVLAGTEVGRIAVADLLP
jgi:Uma2 family endonuclease